MLGMFINSFGWGKSATVQGADLFNSAKIENVGIVEVNAAPSDDDIVNLQDAAATLAKKILSEK